MVGRIQAAHAGRNGRTSSIARHY